MKKIVTTFIIITVSAGTAFSTEYMTPEEIQRIWGSESESIPYIRNKPQLKDIADVIDEYSQAASFIQSLQYLEPDSNFGGLMEAEHLLDIIQTDNTSEAVWIWSRYYQLTGDNQYNHNTLNAWQYMHRWPAWREEGGSHPSSGYYRYYGGGWGLLAEMMYRDAYGTDTFRVYADSVADYMITHRLRLSPLNTMVLSWAMGCLYLYGENTGVQDYINYADSASTEIKAWIEGAPFARLNQENWAMSGGASLWGLVNSYFKLHPDEAFAWVTENAPYLDTLVTGGSWHLAHNAWYALGHWMAFEITGDSTYYYNHAFLTDTLLAQDGDDDGGIPANFEDNDDMDQSWCTAYLGFMCLNPLLEPQTSVQDDTKPLPYEYLIVNNYPNPFNNSTNISYSGFPSGNLKAEVFDILGRRVDVIYNRVSPGSGLINWDASGFSSGVYFIRLSSPGSNGIARAVLIK